MSNEVKDTKINLCDTCIWQIPECEGCGSDEIEFGDGFGNDNVISCPYQEEATDA